MFPRLFVLDVCEVWTWNKGRNLFRPKADSGQKERKSDQQLSCFLLPLFTWIEDSCCAFDKTFTCVLDIHKFKKTEKYPDADPAVCVSGCERQ